MQAEPDRSRDLLDLAGETEVDRCVVSRVSAHDHEGFHLALLDGLDQVRESLPWRTGRRLVKLDRLAQVAEQGVDRKREGVDQRRLTPAGDDDALAGVGPQIRGDLANPP